MANEDDYLLALKLQEEFDREANSEITNVGKLTNNKRSRNNYGYDDDDDDDLNTTQNLVHPQWETLDPTPDVKALFIAFDNKFFQGRLKCVELEWSKRMYQCAGICYTRRNRMGMSITIRLSEPLLKLRSRKDLIETLLHEMIHAYCGVLRIREGNGGHGPYFRKIMNGINKVAGTNITVYHNFHDEVNVYKTHWWRCNGICQNRSPFFGYVKRTSNRAPGPNDLWWKQHLESCGGSFLKIKGPENKKTKLKNEKKNKENIRLSQSSVIKNSNIIKYFTPAKNVDTTTNKKNDSTSTVPKTSGNSGGGGNLNNVVSFKDLSEGNNDHIKSKSLSSSSRHMFGTGYSLISSSPKNKIDLTNKTTTDAAKTAAQELRDIWAKKYPPSSSPSKNIIKETDIVNLGASTSKAALDNDNIVSCGEPKKRRISGLNDGDNNYAYKNDNNGWTVVDDEVMIKDNTDSIINVISSSSDNSDEENDNEKEKDDKELIKIKKENKIRQTSLERQREIKQEILETSVLIDNDDLTEDDIELIDDEYDDNNTTNNDLSGLLSDTSLVDDLFGEDTLLKDFNNENAVVASGTRYHRNSNKDVIVCPICEERVIRENLSGHLDGCSGITIKVKPLLGVSSSKLPKRILPSSSSSPSIRKNIPNSSGSVNNFINSNLDISDDSSLILNSSEIQQQSQLQQPEISNHEEESEGIIRRRGLVTTTHSCPVCAQEVDVDRINEHLDICLKP